MCSSISMLEHDDSFISGSALWSPHERTWKAHKVGRMCAAICSASAWRGKMCIGAVWRLRILIGVQLVRPLVLKTCPQIAVLRACPRRPPRPDMGFRTEKKHWQVLFEFASVEAARTYRNIWRESHAAFCSTSTHQTPSIERISWVRIQWHQERQQH